MRVSVSVKGKVQGVGFRYFAMQAGRRLGLTGWVRNLPDGRVEAEAQGDERSLKRFVTELEKGPPGAIVDSLKSQPMPDMTGEKDFEWRA